MTTQQRPATGPQDDDDFADPHGVPWNDDGDDGPSEDEVRAWLDDPDDGVVDTTLDELFGPWLGDDELVARSNWGSLVPDRGFFRD